MQNVYNGLRHYRVRITKPIPSFLRFGKYQIFLKHDGQLPTCRRCNLAGHFSNNCNFKVCCNCENIRHEASSCPAPACKEDAHRSRDCRYSWDSPIVRGASTDGAEALPLAAALPSSAMESSVSQPLLVADPPGTDPSIAELDDAELPSVSQATTVSLPDAQRDQSIGTQASSAEPPATPS